MTHPWENEPNRKDWVDDATGLPCMILRGPHGALNGYVGVPARHPAHGLSGYKSDYSIDEVLSGEAAKAAPLQKRLNDVRVHGGVTFTGLRSSLLGDDEGDGYHWFGFDCAHAGDFCPGYEMERINDPILGLGKPTGWGTTIEYRDLTYVEGECTSLARQLAALEHGPDKAERS